MVAHINTLAFDGIQTLDVEVQVQISNGLHAFSIVGLPDKAVAESKERVRSALHAIGLSLPPKRVTVNLAPADLAKEGSHFDLAIALGVMAAMGAVSQADLIDCLVLGELGLDGSIRGVQGVLPAAIHAKMHSWRLICPGPCRQEAVWAGDIDVIGPNDLLELVNHLKGVQLLSQPEPMIPSNENGNDVPSGHTAPDIQHVKGQETAKRALEIAAAGAHNLLMVGPPGAGKSMMANAFPGLLPPLEPAEALEVSMIHSLAGTLPDGGLLKTRPFRDPHHSASLPALIGGGHKVRPGEVALAHRGVLFLDELPEFARSTLEALRQPLENGNTLIARANRHVSYPARFQLIAAMNPCRCGYLGDEDRACAQAPKCAGTYQAKISGPLLDRIDMKVETPPVSYLDLTNASNGESSSVIAGRVRRARDMQKARYQQFQQQSGRGSYFENAPYPVNAYLAGEHLDRILTLDENGRDLLNRAANSLKLSARSYYRLLKVARTIADLAGHDGDIGKSHMAEALSYRQNAV